MKTIIRNFSFLSFFIVSMTSYASPCDPLMIFNNQTDLKGYYFGNDASGPMPEINSIYETESDPRQKVWTSETCHIIFETGDKTNWDAFTRSLTKMTFYSSDATQKTIPCTLPADASLKNTKSMTTTVSKNAAGQYVCQITREGDSAADYKFLVFGGQGMLLSSGDGVHWTQVLMPQFSFFRNMTKVKNQYLAVGSNYFASADGITWNSLRLGSASDVIWANNQYYSVGGVETACGDPICFSQDGLSWKSAPFYSIRIYLYRIVKNDANVFVAVGTNDNNGIVVSSIDGKNWVKTLDIPKEAITSVAWGNNQFIAVGTSGMIFTSVDGINWKKQESGSTAFLQSIVWGKDKFVVVGGGAGANVILSSLNGVTWTAQKVGTTNPLHRVSWNSDGFMAVGDNGTIISSPDGIKWTLQNSGTSQDLWGIGQL